MSCWCCGIDRDGAWSFFCYVGVSHVASNIAKGNQTRFEALGLLAITMIYSVVSFYFLKKTYDFKKQEQELAQQLTDLSESMSFDSFEGDEGAGDIEMTVIESDGVPQ